MQTLYDSDAFSVNHLLTDELSAESERSREKHDPLRPTLQRHGFEIVDKRQGREIYLDGAWAELFQQRLMDWQRNTPTQDEVEDTLAQYAELAQHSLHLH